MALVRVRLATQISNLTVLNVSGMKVMASALSSATQIPFQVTRQLAVIVKILKYFFKF